MTLAITVEPRPHTGTHASRKLRAAGRVSAIIYGAGMAEGSFPISVALTDFEKVWHEAGESTVIDVHGVPGGTKAALIHDVTVEPLYGTPIHIDFYAVRTDRTVEVSVPLVFTGTAPAEKGLGGTLIKVMHEVDIEALPKDLPHEITIDISTLKTFEDQIHIRDIKLPTGVQMVTEADEVVALVQEPISLQEEAGAEPIDLSKIAVEKKGKEEVAE